MGVDVFESLKHWLEKIDPVSSLECDGVTRCISTVLTTHGVAHDVHVGRIGVDGLGTMTPHWWIELSDGGLLIDLRARMWLGDSDEVPHGIFAPGRNVHYETGELLASSVIRLHPHVFEILTDMPLKDFVLVPSEEKAMDPPSMRF